MQYLTKATTGYDLKRSTHNHMILHATRGHGRGNLQPAIVLDGVAPRHATVPDGVAPHDLPRHATLRLWILERHGDFPDGLDEPTLVLGRRDAAVDTEDLTSKAQPTGKRFFPFVNRKNSKL